MSQAGIHYDRFKKDVARNGVVFTFKDEGHYLIFRVAGHDVIPF